MAFDFIAVVEPLRFGFNEKFVVLNPDLDRVANDHFLRNMTVSNGNVSEVIHLDDETEANCTCRELCQFRGLVGFLSGLSDAAQA